MRVGRTGSLAIADAREEGIAAGQRGGRTPAGGTDCVVGGVVPGATVVIRHLDFFTDAKVGRQRTADGLRGGMGDEVAVAGTSVGGQAGGRNRGDRRHGRLDILNDKILECHEAGSCNLHFCDIVNCIAKVVDYR
ncbi:hypothetical protein D3C81_1279110 [compost metagenome]